jgi:hypothetical protein
MSDIVTLDVNDHPPPTSGNRLAVLAAEIQPPCNCEWCKRYRKEVGYQNIRPRICDGPWDVPAPSGRCIRCHWQLPDLAYMVATGVANSRTGWTRAPVCEACIEPEEVKSWTHKGSLKTCRGCGRRLRLLHKDMSWRGSDTSTCSNACYRKGLAQTAAH